MEEKKLTQDERFLAAIRALPIRKQYTLDRLLRTLTLLNEITEEERADAAAFRDALFEEANAGTLTNGKLEGYVAAMEAALAYNNPACCFNRAESALSQINCDFRTLEVTLDRFFNETLPEHRASLEEISTGLLMDCDAVTDIYNTFSENVREEIDKGLSD